MGWAGGSEVLANVWDAVQRFIPKKAQMDTAKELIEIFEGEDCDTIQEVFHDWPIFEKAHREMYPDLYED